MREQTVLGPENVLWRTGGTITRAVSVCNVYLYTIYMCEVFVMRRFATLSWRVPQHIYMILKVKWQASVPINVPKGGLVGLCMRR